MVGLHLMPANWAFKAVVACFKKFYLFYSVYVYECFVRTYVCVSGACLVPAEVRMFPGTGATEGCELLRV